MEYFWLAERILAQMYRKITEQQREEIVAEAVCTAWCSREPLSYLLMRHCVRYATWKHSYGTPSTHLPWHTLQGESFPPPELPHQADVIRLADYRQMPTNTEKLAFAKKDN